ncbi:hypothetical protein WA158_003022 [Blastocystis sp. Blastoise]
MSDLRQILSLPTSFGIEKTQFGSNIGLFDPNEDNINNLHQARILVLGVGGLGCEILKTLCLSEIRHIDILDMDTVSLSNLNRQFLFSEEDIGQSKAVVAAKKLHFRFPDVIITPHYCQLESKLSLFYSQFDIIICGLDTLESRLHINTILFNLLQYNRKGILDPLSIRPFIDAGTEGILSSCRLVIPTYTSCISCSSSLYTSSSLSTPLCTIIQTPLTPVHCILYSYLISFPNEFHDIPCNIHNPDHFQYIYTKSKERASLYHIEGITSQLILDTITTIIPSIPSVNSVISSITVMETIKLLTGMGPILNNFLLCNHQDGCTSISISIDKKQNCNQCNIITSHIQLKEHFKLNDLLNYLHTKHYIFQSIQLLHKIQIYHKGQLIYADNLSDSFSSIFSSPLSQVFKDTDICIEIRSEETIEKGGKYLLFIHLCTD